MRIILFLTLALLFVASSTWGQQAVSDKECTAIVQGQTAQFIFQLPQRQAWIWNRRETKDNHLEYAWEISLTGADSKATYNFGVYLFKYPNSQEITGGINDLISTAQTTVWEKSLHLREDLVIHVTIEEQKVTLKVSDKKTFDELFSQKPTIAHCRLTTPDKNINFVSKTQIKFIKK